MSSDPLSDFALNLAAGLTQTLLESGARRICQAAMGTDEDRALRAALDQGFGALLAETDGQLPDGDNRREQVASIQNDLHTFFRQPDIAENILSSVISGSSLNTAYFNERYAAMTSEPEFPSLDFSQCLKAFFLVAASNWQKTQSDGSARTSYNVFIERNLGPLAIGDDAQATTSYAAEPRAIENLAANEVRYRERVVEQYNRLGFGGLGQVDLRLSDVALEDVFVRMTLTVEKVVREQVSPDEGDPEQRQQGLQERSPRRDQETIQGAKESERKRERIVVVQEPITLAAALEQNALIVGEPGAGKSTLLRWLAVTFAAGRQQESDRLGASADADRLPLFVELGRLPERYLQAESRETLNWADFLPDHIAAQPLFHGIPPALLATALADGHCLLLCDGLDEIADMTARRRIANSLADYARSSANRLVLSSRPAGVSGSEGALGGRFQGITIQRFTPDDVQRFFRFWYALDASLAADEQTHQADALFAKVQAAPKTLELAGTPLLATLLLLIWRNEGDLPERRVELYERCCRILIESWEVHHDVAYTGALRDIGWERHLRLLAPLAYTVHNREQRTDAPLAELAPVLATALQAEGIAGANATLEAEKFLRTLSLRSGLLQFLGSDRYGFPHLTFQEYLAARHIAAQPDPDYIDLVMVHLHEGWWREVHLLLFSQLGPAFEQADKAARLMMMILDAYQPPWRILRARRVNWWDLPAALSRALSVRVNWQWERRVAWILDRELLLVLSGVLGGPQPNLYGDLPYLLLERAEQSMRQLGQDPMRIPWAEKHEHFAIVGNFLRLFDMKIPAVAAALAKVLNDDDWGIRQAAANGLGQLGQPTPEVIAALKSALDFDVVHGLSNDQYWRYEYAILSALVILSDLTPGAVQTLTDALRNALPPIRGRIVYVLSSLGCTRPEVFSEVFVAWGDVYVDTIQDVVETLAYLNRTTPEVIRDVLDILLYDSPKAPIEISRVMDHLAQPKFNAISALVLAMISYDPIVAHLAAEHLERLGVTHTIVAPALMSALGDRNCKVRKVAATLLGRIEQVAPEMISALVAATCDKNEDVREAAVEALGELKHGAPQVLAALIVALSDPEWPVRARAAESLGQLGQITAEVESALAAALNDSKWFVRQDAARTLVQSGRSMPEVASTLVDALDSDDLWDTRDQAAELLWRMGNRTPEIISVLLTNPGYVNRVEHERDKELFGLSGDVAPEVMRDAASGLSFALSNVNVEIRRNGAELLGRIGQATPEIVSSLAAAIGDPDWSVRNSAAHSLGQLSHDYPEAASALMAALGDKDRDVRRLAATNLGQLVGEQQEYVAALLAEQSDADRQVRYEAAISLAELGRATQETISVLVATLNNADKNDRYSAARSLGDLQISDEATARIVLQSLNRRLHDRDEYVRFVAHNAIHKFLDGRPIPGYRWVPLRERREQARRHRIAGYWVLGIVAVLLIAWLAAVVMTKLTIDPFVERFVTALLALVALAAGAVQVLGWFRRPFWDR